MKRTHIAAAAIAFVAASGAASAAPWTTVVEPGAYGRVLVGGYAQPPTVYNQQPSLFGDDPVLSPLGYFLQGLLQPQEPVYMWVPGYQRNNWQQYCYEYNACNVPVYFVQDGWYQQNV
ncbi:MAG TPA: hypothetical protein VH328_03005, partial [Burkholderiaceae bacterium]|nr:hypothetical protein [Burkholderiaceae bacterium]